ncbi:hypothetical protein SHELI_v1c09930 [Spiroplasma helicoides]|uniref:Lipoprotein n=1 Tax=Spiroplasma helicoides TaxID=216938 RepID=A0A1B3SM05_9MOLU|nr:hypothetical protein [Spiroplasma helicoides]AOG60940.1 hypothetical protein SHELI_v1c09930 [Spiroplasma helicoides]
MKKLIVLLSMSFIIANTSLSIVSCSSNNTNKIDISSWDDTQLTLNPTTNTKTAAEREFTTKIKNEYNVDVVKNLDFTDTYSSSNSKKNGLLDIFTNPKSEKLKGNASFKLTYVENNYKTYLSTLPTTELGKFQGYEELPTLRNLLIQINRLNYYFDLTEEEIEFEGDPTLTSCIIKAKESSKNYIGKVTIDYIYEKIGIVKKNLQDLPNKYVTPEENSYYEVVKSAKKALLWFQYPVEEKTDYYFSDYKEATSSNDGSITLTATKESVYLYGVLELKIKYINKIIKKSLGSLSSNDLIIKPTDNNQSQSENAILDKLKNLWGFNLNKGVDLEFSKFVAPTRTVKGSIVVDAYNSSKYLEESSATFTIDFNDGTLLNLEKIENKVVTFEDNNDFTRDKVENEVDKIITKFASKAQKSVDYSYYDYVQPVGQTGYIRVKASESSNVLSGNAIFKINIKFLDLKNISWKPILFPYKNKWEDVVESATSYVKSYAPGAQINLDYEFGEYTPAKKGGKNGSLFIKAIKGSSILKGSVTCEVAYSWIED